MRIRILGNNLSPPCLAPDHEGIHGSLDVIWRTLLRLKWQNWNQNKHRTLDVIWRILLWKYLYPCKNIFLNVLYLWYCVRPGVDWTGDYWTVVLGLTDTSTSNMKLIKTSYWSSSRLPTLILFLSRPVALGCQAKFTQSLLIWIF